MVSLFWLYTPLAALVLTSHLSPIAEPLTEEEQKEKEELSPLGFSNWNKRDFQLFCRGVEVHGKDDYAGIAHEVTSKDIDQVKAYSEVFWDRWEEIEGKRLVRILST